MTTLAFSDIRLDGGTQPRTTLDPAVIADYAEAMAAGAVFPPVVVFYDGESYWLADGFHRCRAAASVSRNGIEVDIRQGTLAEAQWYSYSVNQTHGLRRTNEDKRRAVEAALRHEFAVTRGIRDIARHCGVSEGFVHKLWHDPSIHREQIDTGDRLVTRNGTTYTMNTANIGTTPPDAEYAPIYQLERGVRLWLHNRGLDIPGSIALLEAIKARTPDGAKAREELLTDGEYLPGPRRKGDVLQAANNVLAQLTAAPILPIQMQMEKKRAELEPGPYVRRGYLEREWVERHEQAIQEWEADPSVGTPLAEVEAELAEAPEPVKPAWYQSSESDDWWTPQWLFDLLDAEIGFETDVCASDANHKCDRYFTRAQDGLAQEWTGRCWMNPPYGRSGGTSIYQWIEKAYWAAMQGATVACCIPARTDTTWWWDFCIHGEVRFLKGRIRFSNSDNSAPFPSAIVIFWPFVPTNKAQVMWWPVNSNEVECVI